MSLAVLFLIKKNHIEQRHIIIATTIKSDKFSSVMILFI